MTNPTIKAVDMTRKIRETHYEQLRGKSPEERIAFYRAKAREMQEKADIRLLEQPTPAHTSA